MLLQWTEVDFGKLVGRINPTYNPSNINQYANKNCKKCNGRGYQEYNLGSGYRHPMLSLRIISCQCVDKHFAKLERLKELVITLKEVVEDLRKDFISHNVSFLDIEHHGYTAKNRHGELEETGERYLVVKNDSHYVAGPKFYKGFEVRYE